MYPEEERFQKLCLGFSLHPKCPTLDSLLAWDGEALKELKGALEAAHTILVDALEGVDFLTKGSASRSHSTNHGGREAEIWGTLAYLAKVTMKIKASCQPCPTAWEIEEFRKLLGTAKVSVKWLLAVAEDKEEREETSRGDIEKTLKLLWLIKTFTPLSPRFTDY